MVATAVFSRMNSPGCTSRSDTEPATGARMTASSSFFCASSYGGPAILQARLQAAHGVEGGLVVGLADLQPRFGRVTVGAAPAGRGR